MFFYDVFNDIWVIFVYKYGMSEDVEMKLYVMVCGVFVLDRVSFGNCLIRI